MTSSFLGNILLVTKRENRKNEIYPQTFYKRLSGHSKPESAFPLRTCRRHIRHNIKRLALRVQAHSGRCGQQHHDNRRRNQQLVGRRQQRRYACRVQTFCNASRQGSPVRTRKIRIYHLASRVRNGAFYRHTAFEIVNRKVHNPRRSERKRLHLRRFGRGNRDETRADAHISRLFESHKQRCTQSVGGRQQKRRFGNGCRFDFDDSHRRCGRQNQPESER